MAAPRLTAISSSIPTWRHLPLVVGARGMAQKGQIPVVKRQPRESTGAEVRPGRQRGFRPAEGASGQGRRGFDRAGGFRPAEGASRQGRRGFDRAGPGLRFVREPGGGPSKKATISNLKDHVGKIKQRSVAQSKYFFDEPEGRPGRGEWRATQGHKVPYRFRLADRPPKGEKPKPDAIPYTDYTGLRFPTLETAENYDYHQFEGFQKIQEWSFPIKVPGFRRLNPYLREYIHFLHSLDPVRFSIPRIAERYRLRDHTVRKVIQEWGTNLYLTRSGLCRLGEKQRTREAEILRRKEGEYAKWVGWDELGDEDDPEGTDDESIGDFKGWRSTSDWIRRQKVEVEMMSAFPMMELRNPMPKRVDIDMVVDTSRDHKVINWIDPTDKVVF